MSLLNYEWKPRYGNERKEDVVNYLKSERKAVFEDVVNHDPFLFRDMQKCVDRVKKAVQNKERVMLVGDYDVDGISGVSLLFLTLEKLGAQVSYRIPHREKDGYGLKPHQVEEFVGLGVKLIITVDNGISSKEAIDMANENGIDVIITDHHTIPAEIPEYYACLHPLIEDEKYPFKQLSGAGVAYKFSLALVGESSLAQLACLGTICDIMPIIGENRKIVIEGLAQMKQNPLPGLKNLLEICGIEDNTDYTTFDVGFKIGPRINAAGRMDHGVHALHVLTNHQSSKEKSILINDLNLDRRQKVENYVEKAKEMVVKNDPESIIVLRDKNWEPGVIGLIASGIKEEFGKPVFVFGKFPNNSEWVGSGRSVKGYNITELLAKQKSNLLHFGGHEMACGCSVSEDKIEQVFKGLVECAKQDQIPFGKFFYYDTVLSNDEISQDFLHSLNFLKPYGESNPTPVFKFENYSLFQVFKMGKNDDHLKLILEKDSKKFEAVCFNFGEFFDKLIQANNVNILGNIGLNEWNGETKLQIVVKDVEILD